MKKALSAFIVFLLCSAQALATVTAGVTITAVQNSTGTLVSTIATAAYNQTAGQGILVGLKWEGTDSAPTGITDTAGNTYVAGPLANNATDHQSAQVWYSVTGLGNASNVITVTWASASAQYIMLAPRAYATTVGLAFKASGSGTGTGTTPLSSSFLAGDAAMAANSNFGGYSISSSNAGWTSRTDFGGSVGGQTQDRIDSPGGSYTAGMTLGGSSDWVISAVSLVESAGGSTHSTGIILQLSN